MNNLSVLVVKNSGVNHEGHEEEGAKHRLCALGVLVVRDSGVVEPMECEPRRVERGVQ